MTLFCVYCRAERDEQAFEMVPGDVPGVRVPACRSWVRCYLRMIAGLFVRPR